MKRGIAAEFAGAGNGAFTLKCTALALLSTLGTAFGQDVRRAQPVDEPPIARALPADDDATPPPAAAVEPGSDKPPADEQPSDKRQLDYANALFGRKMYDLAIPEYEKYLSDYPTGKGRANALFGLGESYRASGKSGSARLNFQKVLDDYGDSEFAGPSAYALGVMAFSQKDYGIAQPLFHKASMKSKDAAVALSAKYFEARCLENMKRNDDALALYLQVAEQKSEYRADARATAGAMLLARGRRADALKQYEALSNEAEKPATKAEAAVRAGLIATDLATADRGKLNKELVDKARTLLDRARTSPEAGRWKGIAQAGLLRLDYQSGQFAQLVAEYKKFAEQLPDEAKPEAMLLAGNAQRQLGHTAEAEALYRQIIDKFPGREEAKEARYQRLINVYNSDSHALIAEVDEFLTTNPAPERAEQARLLKAEALYKQGNFADAARIYEQLRSSTLAPNLRAEAAYKLGWCAVQIKDPARIIEAFSYFLKAFPDSPQAPVALVQRATAYQQSKNVDAAISDLDTLLTKFPKAKEREGALEQKALLLGEQNKPAEMSKTFAQLLKEFPKTPAAAQANYYIGKAAFDLKEYKRALAPLDAARRLDRERYDELATVRIILADYYLHDRQGATSEVDGLLTKNLGNRVPAEVLEWLGIEFYNEKNYALAEKYLSALSRLDNSAQIKPDYWFYLGDAATKLKNYDEADNAFTRYLQTSTDPAGKAKTLLALGATKIAAHKADDAEKIATEIMSLQPEGKVNAEARLLAGDVQFERQHFDDAGKAYAGVALLYDDPAITPRALDKAAEAYRRAGKTEEADRVAKQLRDRYPNYAGG
ncbi:MAG: tetratricopeptide repeat protein [Verrucomicrobia bacterium]|nr:tetratricopeptide repeat protein [Verrucomicrobiota bacterium]